MAATDPSLPPHSVSSAFLAAALFADPPTLSLPSSRRELGAWRRQGTGLILAPNPRWVAEAGLHLARNMCFSGGPLGARVRRGREGPWERGPGALTPSRAQVPSQSTSHCPLCAAPSAVRPGARGDPASLRVAIAKQSLLTSLLTCTRGIDPATFGVGRAPSLLPAYKDAQPMSVAPVQGRSGRG